MNELEDWQLSILVDAKNYDNPSLVEANDAETLMRHRDRIDSLRSLDDPVVIERDEAQKLDEADALLEARSEVDGEWSIMPTAERDALKNVEDVVGEQFGEALSEKFGFKEAVVESMSVPSMVQQFQNDDDGSLDMDALSQQPETGGQSGVEANAENRGEDDDESDDEPEFDTPDEAFDALDRGDQREVATLSQKHRALADRTPQHAERIRGDIADRLGLESDALEASDVTFDKQVEVV
jgi:hypothetical protein